MVQGGAVKALSGLTSPDGQLPITSRTDHYWPKMIHPFPLLPESGGQLKVIRRLQHPEGLGCFPVYKSIGLFDRRRYKTAGRRDINVLRSKSIMNHD